MEEGRRDHGVRGGRGRVPVMACQRPTGESWDEPSVGCEAAGLARVAGDWSAPRDCAPVRQRLRRGGVLRAIIKSNSWI